MTLADTAGAAPQAAPRSTRAEIRNPILALPEMRAILALPLEQRRPVSTLLRALATSADEKAEIAWKQRKGPIAAYWRATTTYCRHLARALEKTSL